ncbi:MAG: cytochrome c biogenesis protein CcsA [Candidatus Brocadiaceae bacterium]|nr:cytochrome c biogenesis protein CcsA [Candidatus Brocadiaceae bacterium]
MDPEGYWASRLAAAALVACTGAAAAWFAGRRPAGTWLFRAGFGLLLAAVAVRWTAVGHTPMKNLFEVFLCMATLCYPLSAFFERRLRVPGRGEDALMAALFLVPVAFVFDPAPLPLPPILRSRLFGPHILAYLAGYLVMLRAGVQSVRVLASGGTDARADEGAHRLARFGFPLLTLGLVLGSVWGQRAWGDYWNWDPKELWALAMWLVYVGYFQWRRLTGGARRRANAAFVLAGCGTIAATLLWANLARVFAGLHSYAS